MSHVSKFTRRRKVTLITPSEEPLEVLISIPQSGEFKGTGEAATKR